MTDYDLESVARLTAAHEQQLAGINRVLLELSRERDQANRRIRKLEHKTQPSKETPCLDY